MNKFDKEGLTSKKVISDVITTSDGQLYLTSDAADSRYMPIDAEVGGGETHVVGEQWISFDGTIPVGGIPFLGQLVYREQYKELYDFIKKNNRYKTEEEWQTISNTNKGNVPYYALDEIAGVNASATNASYVPFDITAINVIKDGNIIETITFDEPFSFVDGFDTTALETLVNEKSNLITLTVGDREGYSIIFYPLTFTYNEAGTIGNDVTVQIVGTDSTIVDYYILSGGVDYVSSETIRMPKFNGYFKGADEAGNYVAEGLPNITGDLYPFMGNSANNYITKTGAFSTSSVNTSKAGTTGTAYTYRDIQFNASLSNPIYGNSEHVTPETNTVIVGVYAFGTITNNSNIDVEDIIHAYESNDKVIQSFDSKLDASLLPVGSIIPYAASKKPDGYLICDGSKISRTTYSALFAAIGTTWGAGDGSTTFALPNLTGRFIEGHTTSGTYKDAGLPNITGKTGVFENYQAAQLSSSGALFYSQYPDKLSIGGGGSGYYYYVNLDASKSNAIYGKSTTVQPKSATVLYIIKYQ